MDNEYKNKMNIFKQIKDINPNADFKRYEKMSITQMLAVLSAYKEEATKTDDVEDEEELEEINIPVDKAYETDESAEARTGKGLEAYDESKKIVEGIYLNAHVRDNETGKWEHIISTDFENVASFAQHLRDQKKYAFHLIQNKQDEYVAERTKYDKLNKLRVALFRHNEIAEEQIEMTRQFDEGEIDDYEYEMQYPIQEFTEKEYKELDKIYNDALRIPLTESKKLTESMAMPNYNITPSAGKIVLYHNTTAKNVDSILQNGIKADAGISQGRGKDGNFIWATSTPNLKGYGGNTIAFEVDAAEAEKNKVNDDEYTLTFDVPAGDILFVDRPFFDTSRLSDMVDLVKRYGIDKVKDVISKRPDKLNPIYDLDTALDMLDEMTLTEGYKRKDMWEEMVYLYDLIENQGKKEYRDEYMSVFMNYDLAGGRKGVSKNTQKYTDLYYKLLDDAEQEIEHQYDTLKESYSIGDVVWLDRDTWEITKGANGHPHVILDIDNDGDYIVSKMSSQIQKSRENSNGRFPFNEYIGDAEGRMNKEGIVATDQQGEIQDDDIYRKLTQLPEKIVQKLRDLFYTAQQRNMVTVLENTNKGFKVITEVKHDKQSLIDRIDKDVQTLYDKFQHRDAQAFIVLKRIIETALNKNNDDAYFDNNNVIIVADNSYIPVADLGSNYYDIIPFLLGMQVVSPDAITVKTTHDLNSTEIWDVEKLLSDMENKYIDKETIVEKLEEASRNELLAKAKLQTKTRYRKSEEYKGFSLVDVDTTTIKTTDSLVLVNRVGKYWDTVELLDILYWVGLEVERASDHKVTAKICEKALMGAIDGMDIKIDCTCGDFIYRFAYEATKFDYKYGKPETRPAKITNPEDYGSMCKHLISMLSNKKWLQKCAGTLNDWIINEIEFVREFLGMSEEELQLPNEIARQYGKEGSYAKTFKDVDNEEEIEEEEIPEEEPTEEPVDEQEEELEEIPEEQDGDKK